MFEVWGHEFKTLKETIDYIDGLETLTPCDRLIIKENNIPVLTMYVTEIGRFWNTI